MVKTLCDELYPAAEKIVLVMDQLNTHGLASLYEVRSWAGWHRHMTLAMTAQALLAITRARLFAKPAASEKTLVAFKKSRGLPVVVG